MRRCCLSSFMDACPSSRIDFKKQVFILNQLVLLDPQTHSTAVQAFHMPPYAHFKSTFPSDEWYKTAPLAQLELLKCEYPRSKLTAHASYPSKTMSFLPRTRGDLLEITNLIRVSQEGTPHQFIQATFSFQNHMSQGENRADLSRPQLCSRSNNEYRPN